MRIVFGPMTHDIQSREVYNATFPDDLVLKKQPKVKKKILILNHSTCRTVKHIESATKHHDRIGLGGKLSIPAHK